MFDLEQAITKWKQQMMVGGIKNPAVLDELESHLREEIERQTRAGVPAERAFKIAVQKIGPANALKSEFRKNGSASMAEKLMIAVAASVIAFGVFMTALTVILCYDRLGDRVIGLAAVGLSLLAFFGLSRTTPLWPADLPEYKRVALALACMLGAAGVCTFFIHLILPHFEHRPDAMVPPVTFWALLPLAIGAGLLCSIEKVARVSRKISS